MTTQFIFVKKYKNSIRWSDQIEFLKFKYAAITYSDGVLCIKPCSDKSNKAERCKEVKRHWRKYYVTDLSKVPRGYYVLDHIDTKRGAICFKRVGGNEGK